MTMKGSALRLVSQNTIRPLFSISIPEGILTDLEEGPESKEEPMSKEKLYAAIYKECTPLPAALKDKNYYTRTLAAIVSYFKIRKHFLEGAKQFKAATRYAITPKFLSEVLHGKSTLAENSTEAQEPKMTQKSSMMMIMKMGQRNMKMMNKKETKESTQKMMRMMKMISNPRKRSPHPAGTIVKKAKLKTKHQNKEMSRKPGHSPSHAA